MICKTPSLLQTIVLAALTGGIDGVKALATPGNLISGLNELSGGALSGVNQTALQVAGQLASAAIRGQPPCLTGIAGTLAGAALAEVGANSNNVFGEIKTELNKFVKAGAEGLSSVFSGVEAAITDSFQAMGLTQIISDGQAAFKQLGIDTASLMDTVTGGLVKEFGPVLNSVEWKTFCANLPNFGQFLDPKNLKNSLTFRGICNTLINTGMTTVMQQALRDAGVTNGINGLDLASDVQCRQALASLTPAQVDQALALAGVRAAEGFPPPTDITSLVTTPEIFLGSGAAVLGVNPETGARETFTSTSSAASSSVVADKLFQVFGHTVVSEGVAQFAQSLSQVFQPNLTRLSQVENVPTAWTMAMPDQTTVRRITGQGSGVIGNPRISDVIGLAAGIGYTIQVKQILKTQQAVRNSAQGQVLEQAIAAAIKTPSNDAVHAAAITAANSQLMNSTDPVLLAEIAAGNKAFDEIIAKYVLEKRNQQILKINVSDYLNTGNVSDLVAFVDYLHQVHDDPAGLGMEEFITALSTDGLAGEALRATIVEGKNLAVFSEIGSLPEITVDALAYSRRKFAQLANLSCCPADTLTSY